MGLDATSGCWVRRILGRGERPGSSKQHNGVPSRLICWMNTPRVTGGSNSEPVPHALKRHCWARGTRPTGSVWGWTCRYCLPRPRNAGRAGRLRGRRVPPRARQRPGCCGRSGRSGADCRRWLPRTRCAWRRGRYRCDPAGSDPGSGAGSCRSGWSGAGGGFPRASRWSGSCRDRARDPRPRASGGRGPPRARWGRFRLRRAPQGASGTWRGAP